MGFNEIFEQLSLLKLAVSTPRSATSCPAASRSTRSCTTPRWQWRRQAQADRPRAQPAGADDTNLLKRLESSVQAFRLTLQSLRSNHTTRWSKISAFNQGGLRPRGDMTRRTGRPRPEDDDLPDFGTWADGEIGGKVKISLADMDLPSLGARPQADLRAHRCPAGLDDKITPADDAKLQHLKGHVLAKIASRSTRQPKVLIFTAFADTADYLYANLRPSCCTAWACTAPKSPARARQIHAAQELATTSRSC
jgi:hypothetical protein